MAPQSVSSAAVASQQVAISVDLDPLTAYYDIHGLGAPPPKLRFTILRCALPRFAALFDALGVRATFFVVGRDLEKNSDARALIRDLALAGHEIGNHTYSHPYELSRLPEAEIEREIRGAHEVIVQHLGATHAPCGFRAPGYSLSAAVYRALVAAGYRYDSSIFPSPPYYLAKMAVLLGMGLRGRRSGAVLSDPRCLLAPRDPYRPAPHAPWRRGDGPLVEFPVAVSPRLRLPTIGTLFMVSPPWLRHSLLRAVAARPFVNLELHGIDLTDAVADRIPTELAGRQPDLRVPVAEKYRILAELISRLKETHHTVLLRDAATACPPRVL